MNMGRDTIASDAVIYILSGLHHRMLCPSFPYLVVCKIIQKIYALHVYKIMRHANVVLDDA